MTSGDWIQGKKTAGFTLMTSTNATDYKRWSSCQLEQEDVRHFAPMQQRKMTDQVTSAGGLGLLNHLALQILTTTGNSSVRWWSANSSIHILCVHFAFVHLIWSRHKGARHRLRISPQSDICREGKTTAQLGGNQKKKVENEMSALLRSLNLHIQPYPSSIPPLKTTEADIIRPETSHNHPQSNFVVRLYIHASSACYG